MAGTQNTAGAGKKNFFNSDLFGYICLAAGTAAFMLVFVIATSPLAPTFFGKDAAFFTVCGQALAKGRTPYLDFFDMKGPMIFFVEALGQRLAWGTLGAFLIQIPFTFLAALGLYKSARLFAGVIPALAGVFFSFLFMAATAEGGNLTEDYCLPFAVLCLYMALRLARAEKPGRRKLCLFALVCGVSSGFILWLKVTHGALIYGAVLYFVCRLVHEKDWRTLGLCALAFLAGLAAVTAPVLAWFASRGAVHELIRGTFLIPLGYAEAGLNGRDWTQWVTLAWGVFPALAAMGLVLLTGLHRDSAGRLILCCAALSVAALLPGYAYSHYFTMIVPYVTLDAVLLARLARDRRKLAAALTGLGALILILSALPAGNNSFWYIREGMARPVSDQIRAYRDQARLIPPEEQDSVLAYNIPPSWYEVTDILPCYRYFAYAVGTWQEQVTDEYIEMLRTDPPKWFAVRTETLSRNSRLEAAILDALAERYELVNTAAEGTGLYRLAD